MPPSPLIEVERKLTLSTKNCPTVKVCWDRSWQQYLSNRTNLTGKIPFLVFPVELTLPFPSLSPEITLLPPPSCQDTYVLHDNEFRLLARLSQGNQYKDHAQTVRDRAVERAVILLLTSTPPPLFPLPPLPSTSPSRVVC